MLLLRNFVHDSYFVAKFLLLEFLRVYILICGILIGFQFLAKRMIIQSEIFIIFIMNVKIAMYLQDKLEKTLVPLVTGKGINLIL